MIKNSKGGQKLIVPSTSILSELQKKGVDPKRPFRADKTPKRWDCLKLNSGPDFELETFKILELWFNHTARRRDL